MDKCTSKVRLRLVITQDKYFQQKCLRQSWVIKKRSLAQHSFKARNTGGQKDKSANR